VTVVVATTCLWVLENKKLVGGAFFGVPGARLCHRHGDEKDRFLGCPAAQSVDHSLGLQLVCARVASGGVLSWILKCFFAGAMVMMGGKEAKGEGG